MKKFKLILVAASIAIVLGANIAVGMPAKAARLLPTNLAGTATPIQIAPANPVQGNPQSYNQNKTDCTNDLTNNCTFVKSYIQPAVDLFSAIFGIAVVIAIIYGGIEYSSSAGDPQKASAGKNRIRNAILALLGYIFFAALLNFIIPGGLLG